MRNNQIKDKLFDAAVSLEQAQSVLDLVLGHYNAAGYFDLQHEHLATVLFTVQGLLNNTKNGIAQADEEVVHNG